MQATLKGEIIEVPVTTVSVALSDEDDLLMFHCTTCGETVTQYQGYVTKIYPFLEPSGQALTLTRCRKCRRQYRFLTHHGYVAKTVKVILTPTDMGINDFHCYEDKYIVAKFTKDAILSNVDMSGITLPRTVTCPSRVCGIEYYFAEIV